MVRHSIYYKCLFSLVNRYFWCTASLVGFFGNGACKLLQLHDKKDEIRLEITLKHSCCEAFWRHRAQITYVMF
jgi:hypothetical protein